MMFFVQKKKHFPQGTLLAADLAAIRVWSTPAGVFWSKRRYGCFQKQGENHQNERLIMENLMKMDDLGVPLFLKPTNKQPFFSRKNLTHSEVVGGPQVKITILDFF